MAGITEDLQRSIDVYLRQFPLGPYDVDPQEQRIANLKSELQSARYEASQARRLAEIVKAERDAAVMERDMALRTLVEFVEHLMADQPPPHAEPENPAVRAVKVMQNIGAAR